MTHQQMMLWARAVIKKQRKQRIPGTLVALNNEVQATLLNRALTPTERGTIASSLITAKVIAAHKIGE